MLFLGNGLKIGWPFYFKIFRKTHVFFLLKKWSQYRVTCPFWTSKEIILPRGVKQCRLTFPILFRSSVDLRFCISTSPKNLELFGFRHTFPARLVLWQYSMHVFLLPIFGNIGPLFPLWTSSSSCFHLFVRPILLNWNMLHALNFLSFSCLMKRSPVPYGALSYSIKRCFVLYFYRCFNCLFHFLRNYF
jgi:hypothetical protein